MTMKLHEDLLDDGILGQALLVRARNAIGGELGLPGAAEPEHPALARPGATFVTLTGDAAGGHALRGCIGSLEPWRSLDEDVRANARAAAFRDPRFIPLRRDEWSRILVEVSLLAPAEPLPCGDEAEALAQLRPGRDGLILGWHEHRATFLPQVWESLPEPGDFLRQLKRKAGLAADFWSPELVLERYEVRQWKEKEAATA